MGWEERCEMFLRVLEDDQLIGAEIVEGMNKELGVPEGDYKVLHTSNIRQLALRLVKEGKLREELEIVRNRSRYRYSRKQVEVAERLQRRGSAWACSESGSSSQTRRDRRLRTTCSRR
jgi:hypothetical protein